MLISAPVLSETLAMWIQCVCMALVILAGLFSVYECRLAKKFSEDAVWYSNETIRLIKGDVELTTATDKSAG